MKAEPSPEVGIWLRHVLDQLGVSRNALANAAGISPGTLRNAERGRHRISRQTARRLMQEIANRDAMLVHSAPSPLYEAAPPRTRPKDRAARLPRSTPAPLAQLRLQPFGPQMLLQLELDQPAVRSLFRAFVDLLTRSEHAPGAALPALHLMLIQNK